MTTPTPEALTAAELDALIDQSQCITYYTSSDEAERLIKKLAVALAALREQVAAKDADIAAIRELMNVYNLGGWTDAIAPMKRALAAEADNAALRQDAERYRWLRRRNDEVAGGVAANIRVKYRCVESELDAAIDAAMREGKE